MEQKLKQKYQTVFQEMERQQVRVRQASMEGEKLYILAYAPSDQAKNKVWDEIKNVDPSYHDLNCDIRVGEEPVEEGLGGLGNLSSLAAGLAAAFRSDSTPPFGSMLGQLFGNSSGEQRAGVLNQLLSVVPPSVVSQVAGMLGGKKQVTAEEAQQVSPEQVEHLAAKAEEHDSSIIDKLSGFYADHPDIVKTIGSIAQGLRGRLGGQNIG